MIRVVMCLEDTECICELYVCVISVLRYLADRVLECVLGAENYNILFLLLEFDSHHERFAEVSVVCWFWSLCRLISW